MPFSVTEPTRTLTTLQILVLGHLMQLVFVALVMLGQEKYHGVQIINIESIFYCVWL